MNSHPPQETRRRREAWQSLIVCVALLASLAACHRARADLSAKVLADPHKPTLVWQRVNDMPEGVFSAASSQWKRQAIVTGGLNQEGNASQRVQVLDLDTLTWTTPVTLPTGVSYHTQVTLADGRIFIAGGKTGNVLGKLQPVANTWIISEDRKTVVAGPALPSPASELTSHLLPDGRVMVIGNNTASVYDPHTDSWAMQIELREKRNSHASAMLSDGRVLVVGGVNRRTMELVDPASRISRQLATQFSGPRDDLDAVTLSDGRVMILEGQHSATGDTVDENWVLDISNRRKSVMTAMRPLGIPGGAADMAVATLGRWIFALGGETQKDQADTELTTARIIDGKTLELWSLPDMTVAHDDAKAVTDGHSVLIIGGYSMNLVKLGPLETRMPTAVYVVERLTLPVEKFE